MGSKDRPIKKAYFLGLSDYGEPGRVSLQQQATWEYCNWS